MRKYLFLIVCAMALLGCKEYHPSDDPSLRLSFSTDTLSFDTVITEQGSATLQLKVYNRNASALVIKRIWLEDGEAFTINIDGEADFRAHDQYDHLRRRQPLCLCARDEFRSHE